MESAKEGPTCLPAGSGVSACCGDGTFQFCSQRINETTEQQAVIDVTNVALFIAVSLKDSKTSG
jgi:hypothetical protein